MDIPDMRGYARMLEDDLADLSLVATAMPKCSNCRRESEQWSQHAIITQDMLGMLRVPRTACPLSPSCPCQRTAAGLQHRLNHIA